ncbi:hypothetical protein KIPB_012515, partial [Kipferlia bialata]
TDCLVSASATQNRSASLSAILDAVVYILHNSCDLHAVRACASLLRVFAECGGASTLRRASSAPPRQSGQAGSVSGARTAISPAALLRDLLSTLLAMSPETAHAALASPSLSLPPMVSAAAPFLGDFLSDNNRRQRRNRGKAGKGGRAQQGSGVLPLPFLSRAGFLPSIYADILVAATRIAVEPVPLGASLALSPAIPLLMYMARQQMGRAVAGDVNACLALLNGVVRSPLPVTYKQREGERAVGGEGESLGVLPLPIMDPTLLGSDMGRTGEVSEHAPVQWIRTPVYVSVMERETVYREVPTAPTAETAPGTTTTTTAPTAAVTEAEAETPAADDAEAEESDEKEGDVEMGAEEVEGEQEEAVETAPPAPAPPIQQELLDDMVMFSDVEEFSD